MTSPPYRTRNDHPEDPLAAYEVNSGTYDSYLADVAAVFAQARGLLRPGGHAVVNAANVLHHGVLTPLAWDLATRSEPSSPWSRTATWPGTTSPPDISGDYLLVFRADP